MNRRTIYLNLPFLALLCFQTTALPLFDSPSLRKNSIINAVATSSGIIDLKKASNSSTTFYVEADLSNLSSSSEKDSSDTVRMMISLVNDETMVSEDCLGFSSYDCSKHNCKRQGSTKTIGFPWFNVTAEASQSELYLDYKYWSLSSADLYIAKSCRGGDSFGSGLSGVLGFGTGSGVVDDFTLGPIFSIFIESDLSAGKLLFKSDTSKYAHASSSPISLSASNGWGFSASSLSIGDSSFYISSLAFDINSDAIGIPENRFKEFMRTFTKSGIWCKEGNYRPYCYTRGELKDLPVLSISLYYSPKVDIPPQIFATLDKDTGVYKYFYLNFKAISPSLTGKNYVSPALKDTVLLDANFMSYYYTIFDGLGSGNKVHLYASTNAPAPPTPIKPSSDSNKIAAIIFAAVGIIVFVGCCYCCCGASGVKDEEKRALVNETTEDFYTTPSQNQNQGGIGYKASPYKSDQQQSSKGGLYQAY